MNYTDEKIRLLLAKNIKKLREEKELSQEKLATKSDISVPFLSSIECGKKWPYPETLGKIAESLDVAVSELFSEGNKLPPSSDKVYVATVIKEILEGQNKAVQDICKEIFDL